MAKVIWTDAAIQDLDDIGEHIAKDSRRYAELTVTKLFSAVNILEEHPKAGKVVPEFGNKLIRELIRSSFRIVYHIIDDFRIDIITVHNCARLIDNTYDFSEFDDE